MIAPRIARELRERGFDVQAVKRDRPELEGASDRELIGKMTSEDRAVVTNNVKDFRPLHDELLGSGEGHAGMVFTFDVTLPRSKSAVGLWVSALEALLVANPGDRALGNRVVCL